MKILIKTILILFLILLFLGNFPILESFFSIETAKEINLKLGDFITTFRSIIIQAFPFLMAGVFISAIVDSNLFSLFYKTKLIKFGINGLHSMFLGFPTILQKIFKSRFVRYIKFSLLGFLIPVCECGNVPVARSLMQKGVRPSETVTFLLAAPILNPITIFSTYEAFGASSIILPARLIAGFVIANAIGLIMGAIKNEEKFLTIDFFYKICNVKNHSHNVLPLARFINVFKNELINIIPILLIGALIASASQIFIPRDIIVAIGTNPVLSILAMLLLAFTISVCSSTDAFIALAYAKTFAVGSVTSFLIFGPMIDIKILTLLKSSFKLWVLALVSFFAFIGAFLTGLILNTFL